MLKKYIKNILIGIDQLANAILFGDPDETISSRSAKLASKGFKLPSILIDKIFGQGHCDKSKEDDEGKNKIIS